MNELIEAERQENSESETNLCVPIENILSTKIEDEPAIRSSDESDLEETLHYPIERIKTERASKFERRRSRPSSERKTPILSKPTRNSNGPFDIGTFIKITNNYKEVRGTVEKVLRSQKMYTTLVDFFGNKHKREHRNFTSSLDK